MAMNNPFLCSAIAFVLIFTFPCFALDKSQHSSKERIISLAPAMTEVLFAVGAGSDVAARTSECDYPPEALALPAICGFDGKTISVEKIIALKPTLVCGSAGMHDWLYPSLSPFGITLYLSRASSVCAVMDEMLEVGRLTQHTEGARSAVHTIEETLKSVPSPACSVSIYWEVWGAPLMAAGGASFLNDIITRAGGKNIFAAISDAYPLVSDEAILAMNPSVVIVGSPAFKDEKAAITALRKRAGWSALDAVKNGRVVLMDEWAVRPGPRVGEAVVLLTKKIASCTSK